MTTSDTKPWEEKRTEETRELEQTLGQHFDQVDSYRYNSASIRVRVIHSDFAGMTREQRDALVEEQLDRLPQETQRDIVMLLTFAPKEIENAPSTLRESLLNTEFEYCSPSEL